MGKLQELAELGQAIWLDYIRRSFTERGDLQKLVAAGLRGITSNPSIFEKAIAGSNDYDQEIQLLADQGKSVDEIYTSLSCKDIQQAADILATVYESTQGADGYVSLEVNPTFAHNTTATLTEAQRLWQMVDRPNLMVKIPATLEGLPAITAALESGINVNVTLIFSIERYRQVMQAHRLGLEKRLAAGKPIHHIASVASFFVSRIDNKIDKLLLPIANQGDRKSESARSLLGKAAVANAKLAYQEFNQFIKTPEFAKLERHQVRLQRPLWASTSTKNPAYSDILYVQTLIGRHTVNTLPQETLDAFLDHGEPRLTIQDDLTQANELFDRLSDLGISIDRVTQELEMEGVAAFAQSFDSLIGSIAAKRLQSQDMN
jgi:transaldolase